MIKIIKLYIFFCSINIYSIVSFENEGLHLIEKDSEKGFKRLGYYANPDHPLSINLNLTDNPQVSKLSQVQEYLREQGFSELIALKESRRRENSHYTLIEYQLTYHQWTICESHLQSYWLVDKQLPTITAFIRTNLNFYNYFLEKPDLKITKENLVKNLSEARNYPVELAFYEQEPCLRNFKGSTQIVWQLKFLLEGIPYISFVTERDVIKTHATVFHGVTGIARIYLNNRLDKKLTDVSLPNLLGSGTLESPQIKLRNSRTGTQIRKEDHRFIFEESQSGFVDTHAFTHLFQMTQFFQKIGFSWPKGQNSLLVVGLVKEIQGVRNNAIFQSRGIEGHPSILLAPGDGEVLDLNLDSDVVSHEASHFLIFQKFTKTTGESASLHEGLADTLTFLKTNDACLGESVCMNTDKYKTCYIRNGKIDETGLNSSYKNCLRSGENFLTYHSPEYESLPMHQKGQLISGLIWDFYRKTNKKADITAKLVFEGIQLMDRSSNIPQFMSSLLDAEEALYKGHYKCDLIHLMNRRCLAKYLSPHMTKGCQKPTQEICLGKKPILPAESTPSKIATKNSTTTKNSLKKKQGTFQALCGNIINSKNQSSPILFFIILMTFPLFVFIFKIK